MFLPEICLSGNVSEIIWTELCYVIQYRPVMEVCMRLCRILWYFYNYSIFDLVYLKKKIGKLQLQLCNIEKTDLKLQKDVCKMTDFL